MDQVSISRPAVDPPRGLFGAKVDDKGRLKLPASFITYLTTLQATKVYVTSLDRISAKIYTTDCWSRNVRILENLEGDERQDGIDLLLLADEVGEDSELDGQGRVLLPTNLRRLLGMESAQVFLQAGEGMINIFSQADMDSRLAKAKENLPSKLKLVQGKGLK